MSKQVKAFCKGRVPVFVERQTGKEVVYGPVTMPVIPDLETVHDHFVREEKKARRLFMLRFREAWEEYDARVSVLIADHFGLEDSHE